MKTNTFIFAIAACLFATGEIWCAETKSAEQSRISITFIKPEAFTDVKDSMMGSDREREGILDEIREYLGDMANRYIAKDQRLDLKITDIDMAGDFEPWRGSQLEDVRIIKDIYPPRINLEFRLTDSAGKVLKEGKKELRDMNFLMKSHLQSSIERLPYEKELLREWFSEEFGNPAKAK